MADVELTALPDWAAHDETVADMSTSDVREAMNDHARVNVAQATAAKDAEIEALKHDVVAYMDSTLAENAALKHDVVAYMDSTLAENAAREKAETRAERLAEALREMIELREATQRGEVHPTRHELDIVKDARALLREQEEGNG